MPLEPLTLATIPKSKKEEVRVCLAPFKGVSRIDVRTYATWGDVEERRPTRDGINLPVESIPDLIRGLQAAAAEAGVAV